MADDSSITAGVPEEFRTIGEHYHLIEKLGEGAFGVVYKAHHELLEQDFAVKVLKPEMCADKMTRDRFLDEARALIRFSHTNVVQLRHVGEHAGQLYLVMDFVRGQPVDELIKGGEKFDEGRAVGVIMQVLMGLEAAHAAGIVHRDLKPSNLILERKSDGTDYVRILDFGLSKLSAVEGEGNHHRSVTGSIIGTLAYMSPEQLSGETEIDGRADVFATGLVLQELMQGHHPYPGESGIVVAAKLLRDPVPPLPDEILNALSDSTKTALNTALERDRDARYASATAFRQALMGKGPPSDTSRITTIEHARQELARQEAEKRRTAPAPAAPAETKSSKKGALVLIGLLVAAAAVAAFLIMGNKGKDDPKANGTEVAGNPDKPDTPAKPDTPVKPDTPENPETPTKPDTPENPETPSKPDTPENPETPTKPDTPENPETPAKPDTPETPETPNPSKPPFPGTPEECCQEALKLRQEGEWELARKTYFHTLTKLDANWLPALRGAGDAYLTEAEHLARKGSVDRALELLTEAITWSGAEYTRYAEAKVAHATNQLQLGFARLYRGRAHLERARWLGVKAAQDASAKAALDAEAKTALDAAKVEFTFAGQHLLKEGLDDAEFRMRRAELSRYQDITMSMIKDLEHITQEANESYIYGYMWVAHARALRRLGEAGMYQQGDRRQASAWAENAWQIARKGASYKEKDLTKREWLEFCRVVWVRSMYEGKSVKLQEYASMLRWWLGLARKAPAVAYESKDLSTAREETADAMLAYVTAMQHHRNNKPALAKAAFQDAKTKAEGAVAKRVAVAKTGERLESALPYRVLGFALMGLGERDAASAAFAKADAADVTNPD